MIIKSYVYIVIVEIFAENILGCSNRQAEAGIQNKE